MNNPFTRRVKQAESRLQARDSSRILSREETEQMLQQITPEYLNSLVDDEYYGMLTGAHLKRILEPM